MFRPFAKWPVLLGAVFCIGVGAVLIRDVPNGNIVTGLMLVALGSLLLGVFVTLYVLESLRHWKRADLESPLPPPPPSSRPEES